MSGREGGHTGAAKCSGDLKGLNERNPNFVYLYSSEAVTFLRESAEWGATVDGLVLQHQDICLCTLSGVSAVFRYLQFSEAVTQGNAERVAELRDGLSRDLAAIQVWLPLGIKVLSIQSAQSVSCLML